MFRIFKCTQLLKRKLEVGIMFYKQLANKVFHIIAFVRLTKLSFMFTDLLTKMFDEELD